MHQDFCILSVRLLEVLHFFFSSPAGWQDTRDHLCGRAGETSTGTGAALEARSQAAGARALTRGDNEVAEERSLAVDVRPGPSREGQERRREGALGREGEEPAPTPPPGRRDEGPGRRREGARLCARQKANKGLVPWSLGPLVPWSLWSLGPLVPWSSGPLVLWSLGPLVLWSSGPLVLRPGLRALGPALSRQNAFNMIWKSGHRPCVSKI